MALFSRKKKPETDSSLDEFDMDTAKDAGRPKSRMAGLFARNKKSKADESLDEFDLDSAEDLATQPVAPRRRLGGLFSRKKKKQTAEPAAPTRRKRINIIAVIVLWVGALLLGAPYYFGMQMEDNFGGQLRQFAQQSGVVIENVRFERGLLSSEASNQFAIPQAKLRIDAVHRIQHGPLPLMVLLEGGGLPTPAAAVVHTTLRLQTTTGADASLAAFAKQVPPLEITTTMGFDGAGHADITMAGMRKQIEKETVQWSGLSGSLDFEPDLAATRMRITSPSLMIKTAQGQVTVNNVALDSNMRRGADGMSYGKTSFVVSKVSAPPVLDMEELRFDADIRPKGKNVEAEVRYSLKQAKLAGTAYGPGEIAVVLRNLDGATLKKFEQELNALQQRKLPEEQMQIIMMGKVMELVGKLAATKPELEVTRLSFRIGDATLKGRAKFTVDAGGQDVAQNPMLLVTAVRGDAEITIPKALLKAAVKTQIERDLVALQMEGKLSTNDQQNLSPAALDRIAEQAYPMYLQEKGFARFLVDNGDHMSAYLQVDGGRIALNGIPLSGAGGMPR
jgi:uncharacterized protein YdgA (DUF945 family)